MTELNVKEIVLVGRYLKNLPRRLPGDYATQLTTCSVRNRKIVLSVSLHIDGNLHPFFRFCVQAGEGPATAYWSLEESLSAYHEAIRLALEQERPQAPAVPEATEATNEATIPAL